MRQHNALELLRLLRAQRARFAAQARARARAAGAAAAAPALTARLRHCGALRGFPACAGHAYTHGSARQSPAAPRGGVSAARLLSCSVREPHVLTERARGMRGYTYSSMYRECGAGRRGHRVPCTGIWNGMYMNVIDSSPIWYVHVRLMV